MKEEKLIFQYRGRSVWLTEKEIELLKFIWLHKIVTVTQIKFMFEQLYGTRPNAIFRRLHKWHDLKIISKVIYSNNSDSRNPLACVFINSNGIDILVKTGIIEEGDESYKNIKLPNLSYADHFFSVREVALRTLLTFQEKGGKFASMPASENPYYDVRVKKAYESEKRLDTSKLRIPVMLEPDWLLVSDKTIVNVEVDTGTENTNRIEEKIDNYIRYNSQNLEDKELHVLIVPIDSAEDTLIRYVKTPPKNRSRRVASIKDAIMRKSGHVIPNLHFHVVTSSRAGIVAHKALTGEYREHSEVSRKVLNALKQNVHVGATITEIDHSEFYPSNVDKNIYANLHLRLEKEGYPTKTILVKMLDEASVKSIDEIYFLNYLIQNGLMKKRVDQVIGVYTMEEEQSSDVFGDRWNMQQVIFSSLEELMEVRDRSPFSYYSSPFSKGRCSLYEG